MSIGSDTTGELGSAVDDVVVQLEALLPGRRRGEHHGPLPRVRGERSGHRVARHVSDLLKSNLVVAVGTALSRVTGLVRVVVFALVLGQTALTDAYNRRQRDAEHRSTSCCSAACCRQRWCRCSPATSSDDDEDATTAVHHRRRARAHRAHGRRGGLRTAHLPPVLASTSPTASTPTEYRAVGTALARIFLIQIFFYGADARWPTRSCNAAAGSSPRRGRPVLSNLVIIATLLLGARHGRRPRARAGRRAHQRPPAVDARARRHRRASP